MIDSPFLDHHLLNSVVLSPKITPNPTRPSKRLHRLTETRLDGPRPLVIRANHIDEHTAISIDAAMDIESPRLQLLVPVLVPERVGASNPVHSTFDDEAVPMSKRVSE